MTRLALLIAGAALVAASVYSRSARAAGIYIDSNGEQLPDLDSGELPAKPEWVDDWMPGQPIVDVPWNNDIPIQFENSPMTDAKKRVDAFLYAIRASEHAATDVATGEDYRTFYGGDRFTNMADHPVITGEKVGVPLPREWCLRLGFVSGRCVTTAAGAYQFTRPTWQEVREQYPRLPDFSPASQDEAARRKLAKIGALSAIERGDFNTAIRLAAPVWASLPGSSAGQGGRSSEFVFAKINEFLGVA